MLLKDVNLEKYRLELRKCPFCGRSANIVPLSGNLIVVTGYFIGCDHPKCLMKPTYDFETPEEAVIAWNTRSSDFYVDESKIRRDENDFI